jgi:Protein of unknown function (DUF2905)
VPDPLELGARATAQSTLCRFLYIFLLSPLFPPLLARYNLPVDPNQQLGRTLLILGLVCIVVGAIFYFGGKLPFRLGRLPGDIVHRGQNGTFYFPLVSCLVISVFISLILWIINQFRR